MKDEMRKQLENKGLTIAAEELDIIYNRWLYGQSLKTNLYKAHLQEADIALKYSPGGEIND